MNIRGVAVTKDGTAWFASGEVEGWRGPTYGLASWGGPGTAFVHIDPAQLGAIEYNILELQALPDGRIASPVLHSLIPAKRAQSPSRRRR